MKKVNQFIAVICFSVLTMVVNANNKDKSSTTKPETTQIQNYLDNLDYRKCIQTSVDMQINFMINDLNEILVVSTNNSDLDLFIKNNLNYKPIQMNSLSHNITYTLPLHIEVKD
jgi:hypothetical protein